jgi:hypothetical protein
MPIFAKDKSTNEDMNRTGTINNALNMRGLLWSILTVFARIEALEAKFAAWQQEFKEKYL